MAHIVSQLEETAGSSFMRWLYSIEMNIVAIKCVTAERRVSTTLGQVLTEFSEFFHVIKAGLLIQTSPGRAGGLGALRTKRSG